jgi:signal transduction histidine kinase
MLARSVTYVVLVVFAVAVAAGAALAGFDHPAPWLLSAACIVLSAGLGALSVASVLQPVRQLTVRVRSLGRPEEPPDALVRTPDAVGDLVASIDAVRRVLTDALAVRRSAREKAEQAELYEVEFLRNLSHELRTPLNAILGFCEVLLEEIDGPITDDQRQDLETIRDSGQYLKDLVDDVIDLAAMQSGRVVLEHSAIDVRPIVGEVTRLLEGQRRGRPVFIAMSVPETPLFMRGDPKRVRQILMNLGFNAMKFTDEGFVRIDALRADDGWVRLTVSDSGPGISRTDLGEIFEEFTQVGDVRRKSQGSGLGLAICKRLADLHGGRIEVESVVGQGSAFHVDFPPVSGAT